MGDKQEPSYRVILFQSVSGALLAEKLLKKEGVQHKLIPVPRNLSSDCGVCLRFLEENEPQVIKIMAGKVDIQSLHSL